MPDWENEREVDLRDKEYADPVSPSDEPEEDAEGEWWNEEEGEEIDREVDDVSEEYDEEYSDNAQPDEEIEQLLAAERVMDKLDPFIEEVKEETEPERLQRMLKRELRQEAISRMEQAARTKQEFATVVSVWNHLDSNRRRRERYHEKLRSPDMLEYGRSDQGLIFPLWFTNPTVRQMYRGDFLDYLFDCPYLMHELSSKGSIRKPVKNLKEDHKELLFFLYLRLYRVIEVAEIRGQSDRNIRKVRKTMLKKLRKQVCEEIKKQQKYGYKPTLRERRLLEEYEESL